MYTNGTGTTGLHVQCKGNERHREPLTYPKYQDLRETVTYVYILVFSSQRAAFAKYIQ